MDPLSPHQNPLLSPQGRESSQASLPLPLLSQPTLLPITALRATQKGKRVPGTWGQVFGLTFVAEAGRAAAAAAEAGGSTVFLAAFFSFIQGYWGGRRAPVGTGPRTRSPRGARLGAGRQRRGEGDCPGSGWEWSAQKEEESVSSVKASRS